MKKFLFCLLLAFPLLAEMNVLVFSGSSRSGSYNKQLALEAANIAKELGAKVTVINLRNFSMPFYDADIESKGTPRNAKRFCDLLEVNDAIIIASPEYNGSIPAVLKNAIDWASRKESAFTGKTFAIMSASPGRLGGARGLNHLRALLEEVGGKVIQKQVAVPSAHQVFGNSESLEGLRKRLREEIVELLK